MISIRRPGNPRTTASGVLVSSKLLALGNWSANCTRPEPELLLSRFSCKSIPSSTKVTGSVEARLPPLLLQVELLRLDGSKFEASFQSRYYK
jgi:hypothetical protein